VPQWKPHCHTYYLRRISRYCRAGIFTDLPNFANEKQSEKHVLLASGRRMLSWTPRSKANEVGSKSKCVSNQYVWADWKRYSVCPVFQPSAAFGCCSRLRKSICSTWIRSWFLPSRRCHWSSKLLEQRRKVHYTTSKCTVDTSITSFQRCSNLRKVQRRVCLQQLSAC